jgi:hypothetical protein
MSGASPGRGVIVAYVAAVVLSVLGVHSLEQHCPIPVPGSSHAEMHLSDVSAVAGAVDRVALESLPAEPVQGGAMLCAAMLLAAMAGVALAWLLGREADTTFVARGPAARAHVHPSGQVRATGPPPAVAFVVLRC